MQHHRLQLPLSAIGVLWLGLAPSAQTAKPPVPAAPVRQVTSVAGRSVLKGAQSMIHGTAVDTTSNPLPNATMRLRNLHTNKVEQTTITNQLGEFTFVARPDVPYVVEIVDKTGRVIAVGDVVTVQSGEVAASWVAIPSRLPSLAGVFGETIGSVISAATGTGITAIESTSSSSSPSSTPPPASPEQ